MTAQPDNAAFPAEAVDNAFAILEKIGKDVLPSSWKNTFLHSLNVIRTATQPHKPYPSGLQKATVHVLLDTLAAAARGEKLDPETCQQIEGIAKEYAHKDFTQDDVLALYDCGHRPQQHPDDAAVEAFAARMKEKLAKKRAEGRGGWEDKTQCSAEFLSQLLREHVQKGDPVDVANLAMMLCMRGEGITPATTAEFKE